MIVLFYELIILPVVACGAWRSSGSSNDELVSNLKAKHVVISPRVEKVLRATDRAEYVTHVEDVTKAVPADYAYADSPQTIKNRGKSSKDGLVHGGITISAPHMHAYALELLQSKIVPGAKLRILDVGSGSGFVTVCLAKLLADEETGLMHPEAEVVGIDVDEDIVQLSRKNCERADPAICQQKNFRLLVGDGWEGVPKGGFEVIHVGAAASVIPQALKDQLAIGGVMAIPVGEEGTTQKFLEVTKHSDGTFTEKPLLDVVYVPLTPVEK